MPQGTKPPDTGLEPTLLDRTSFVPLYYQLQEVLKERIESGRWQPGDAMPSEPELARGFGVSRVVVRQALAILEDDRQIVRIKGRGTFVAQTKLDARAGGLSRLLVTPRPAGVAVKVLDVRTAVVEKSIRAKLSCGNVPILRVTTVLSLRGVPLAIAYSFFRRDEVAWLESVAHPGSSLPGDLAIGDHGVRLARAELSIEASQCGQFEADRFGVPHRSAVFLVLCTEYRLSGDGPDAEVPFEVARVEYRGDLLKFDLEVSPDDQRSIQAVWGLTEQGSGVVARPTPTAG